MATTSVTIRMDEDLKKQVEWLFDDMGLNMTTAITVFAKAVVRKGKIPFEIAADPFYGESNTAYLRRAIAALDAGEGVEHDLIEVVNMSVKQEALQTLSNLPEHVSWNDVIYTLYVRQKISNGLKDISEGKTMSNEEAMKRLISNAN